MTTSLPDLITRGLGGQHVHGFLPGNDNKAAIAAAVAGMLGWSSRGVYGKVTRRGIGEWSHSAHHSERKPADAILFVTWAEVLEVVAHGCTGGHREAYEPPTRPGAPRSATTTRPGAHRAGTRARPRRGGSTKLPPR